jgi:hypothetical protein
MTNKVFKHGKYSCKAYKKTAGKGHEVGMTMQGQTLFVGNFIHAKEAAAWWKLMNAEMGKFMKRYGPAPHAPRALYTKFLSNTMYKAYYGYLDREFTKYNRGFAQAVKKDERKFSMFKRNSFIPQHYTPQKRVA